MNLELSKLNKTGLIKQTHETVKREKFYSILLLQHLLEIEKRGLHLEQGFFNLHNFLVVEFKYSDSEAATRVQAMRLLKAHPEVKEKIAEGKISLSQAADINRFLTSENKNGNENKMKSTATSAPTQECGIFAQKIIAEVEGKSLRESKDILEKRRLVQKPTTHTIEVDEETWQILQEIKRREGSTLRDEEITKKIFKEKILKMQNKKIQNKDRQNQNREDKEIKKKVESNKLESKPLTRYMGKNIKLQLLKEANYQCEFRSPTGKRCECKINLEVDHLYPFAWGGQHEINNTRILCQQHNLHYAEKIFSQSKMSTFYYRT